MKYIKKFNEGIDYENINTEEFGHQYIESFGHFYRKTINGNKILIRIDERGDFGYFVNNSSDISTNNSILASDKIKIINFVKNILFYHLNKFKPAKIYIHGTDLDNSKRIKKDELYDNFLSKIKLPIEYEIGKEFTQYGTQSVIKIKTL